MSQLDHNRLIHLLDYSPEDGDFTNRVRRSNSPAGKIVGSVGSHGYIEIRIDGVLYLAHRLAHFYMTGEWPRQEIDHKNLDTADNRWANIREASGGENGMNKAVQSNNVLGIKCVRRRQSGRYQARMRAGGKEICLGTFATAEEAHAAYAKAANDNYGEFARAS